MDQFVHRENLARFRRRLAEPGLTEDQRRVLLTLLKEAQAKGRQPTPATDVTSAVAPRLGEGGRPHRFIRAEVERVFPEVGQRPGLTRRAGPMLPIIISLIALLLCAATAAEADTRYCGRTAELPTFVGRRRA
jgi:hypothetical protein